ncbi:unnamed protein product [Pieris macdunnoughi]|uniref:Uncharacterized protein n=1 Tax=Pieris macdunnoughi TaxID=345717 RepID=A0A821SG27_9NEOP|nr:unnamed protein product [Pieris macdunnoughi]
MIHFKLTSSIHAISSLLSSNKRYPGNGGGLVKLVDSLVPYRPTDFTEITEDHNDTCRKKLNLSSSESKKLPESHWFYKAGSSSITTSPVFQGYRSPRILHVMVLA